MGQHKYNPTAIAAKNGEIPPKPKSMSKAESEHLIKQTILSKMIEKNPALATLLNNLYKDY